MELVTHAVEGLEGKENSNDKKLSPSPGLEESRKRLCCCWSPEAEEVHPTGPWAAKRSETWSPYNCLRYWRQGAGEEEFIASLHLSRRNRKGAWEIRIAGLRSPVVIK